MLGHSWATVEALFGPRKGLLERVGVGAIWAPQRDLVQARSARASGQYSIGTDCRCNEPSCYFPMPVPPFALYRSSMAQIVQARTDTPIGK